MVDEELLEQFITALDTQELRLGVSQISPKSFDEALHTALKLEALFAVEQAKATSSQSVDLVHEQLQPQTTAKVNITGAQDSQPPQWAKEIIKRQNKIEELLERGERQPGRGSRGRNNKCYHCGEHGHFRRNCPACFEENRKDQGNGLRAGSHRK